MGKITPQHRNNCTTPNIYENMIDKGHHFYIYFNIEMPKCTFCLYKKTTKIYLATTKLHFYTVLYKFWQCHYYTELTKQNLLLKAPIAHQKARIHLCWKIYSDRLRSLNTSEVIKLWDKGSVNGFHTGRTA